MDNSKSIAANVLVCWTAARVLVSLIFQGDWTYARDATEVVTPTQ